mmetsp:Transcript_10789/g.44645  ORF Transcript_10789/g.44645 Transcript_10789/m.44645 type:complete len:228 (+) Transcript_10789:2087-2770(+)
MTMPPCVESSLSCSSSTSQPTSVSSARVCAWPIAPAPAPVAGAATPMPSCFRKPSRMSGALPDPSATAAGPGADGAARIPSTATARLWSSPTIIVARSGWSLTVGLGDAARMASSPRRRMDLAALMGVDPEPAEPTMACRWCGTDAARLSMDACTSFLDSARKASACPESRRASAAASSARTVGAASIATEISSKPMRRSVASRSGCGAGGAGPVAAGTLPPDAFAA